MPNRIIKESICTSDNLTALDWGAQLFFLRLTVQCDDFGRFDGRPAILRAACYPLELDRVSEAQIQGWLDALTAAQLVQQYTVDCKRYLVLSTWSKHQRTRADKSKFPDPPAVAPFCGHLTADARICQQPLSNVPVSENVSVSESENAAAAPQSLPPQPVDYDPLTPHERKRYKLPAGPEPSPAVKLWMRMANEAHQAVTASELVRQKIDGAVRDPDRWEKTVTTWVMRGYRCSNVEGLLDAYSNGFRSNGNNKAAPARASPKVNASGLTYDEFQQGIIRGEIPDGSEWHPVEVT